MYPTKIFNTNSEEVFNEGHFFLVTAFRHRKDEVCIADYQTIVVVH